MVSVFQNKNLKLPGKWQRWILRKPGNRISGSSPNEPETAVACHTVSARRKPHLRAEFYQLFRKDDSEPSYAHTRSENRNAWCTHRLSASVCPPSMCRPEGAPRFIVNGARARGRKSAFDDTCAEELTVSSPRSYVISGQWFTCVLCREHVRARTGVKALGVFETALILNGSLYNIVLFMVWYE